MRVMCLTHSSMPWRFLHPSALHAGCQSACVFIAILCHCELIAGLGQGARCSVVSHLMPPGKHYRLSRCWDGIFDCVGSRRALLGQPPGVNGHLWEWGVGGWVARVL